MPAVAAKRSKAFLVVPIILIGAALYFFPLFRIVPLSPATGAGGDAKPAAFDAAAAAAQLWTTELPAAAERAIEIKALAGPLRVDAETARAQFGKAAGMGAAYFFVRGSGKVIARERNVVRIAVDGADSSVIALRIGPIFGNTVRDGCGLLDVNAFPGLTEFNALSGELNALVEKNVLPILKKAAVGAVVEFAGCAEAPDTAPDADEPLLTVIPVKVEVRG